jgi:hypothetical protein
MDLIYLQKVFENRKRLSKLQQFSFLKNNFDSVDVTETHYQLFISITSHLFKSKKIEGKLVFNVPKDSKNNIFFVLFESKSSEMEQIINREIENFFKHDNENFSELTKMVIQTMNDYSHLTKIESTSTSDLKKNVHLYSENRGEKIFSFNFFNTYIKLLLMIL